MIEAKDRLAQIERQLHAIQAVWPFLSALVQDRIDGLTAQLIAKNDEETRGRIKALQDLMELPVTLQQERDGISAGLSDSDPA